MGIETHGAVRSAPGVSRAVGRSALIRTIVTLAGLIRAPQTHSPHRHPERALERRNGVLQAMVDLGLVTPDRAMVAAREPLCVIRVILNAESG